MTSVVRLIRSDSLGSHDVPSTLLGVAALGYDDQLVEIEAVAAVAADLDGPA